MDHFWDAVSKPPLRYYYVGVQRKDKRAVVIFKNPFKLKCFYTFGVGPFSNHQEAQAHANSLNGA